MYLSVNVGKKKCQFVWEMSTNLLNKCKHKYIVILGHWSFLLKSASQEGIDQDVCVQ